MDIFVERIVSKKKGPKDYLKALGIVLIAFLVSMVVTAFFFPGWNCSYSLCWNSLCS